MVLYSDLGHAHHGKPVPHRRPRRMEHLSLGHSLGAAYRALLWQKIYPPRPADHGAPGHRPEAQPQSHAYRRCRPSCKMVLRAQAGLARLAPNRRAHEASYERAGDTALEELNALDGYTDCHADVAPLQRKHPYSLPSNRRNKFKS